MNSSCLPSPISVSSSLFIPCAFINVVFSSFFCCCLYPKMSFPFLFLRLICGLPYFRYHLVLLLIYRFSTSLPSYANVLYRYSFAFPFFYCYLNSNMYIPTCPVVYPLQLYSLQIAVTRFVCLCVLMFVSLLCAVLRIIPGI